MPDDGSVRADALNLKIGEHRLRVFIPDVADRELLAETMQEYLTEEAAPPALRLKPPAGRDRFHILIDRSGFVLARSRTSVGCLAVAGNLLANLQSIPDGCIRLPLRAIASEEGVVLAAFPLFTTPPLIERRLERIGYSVVDVLAATVDDSLALRTDHPPWPEFRIPEAPLGHWAHKDKSPRVMSVLLPQVGSTKPSRAESVAYLAARSPYGRDHALDISERLAELVKPVPVDRSAVPLRNLYSLLQSIRSS